MVLTLVRSILGRHRLVATILCFAAGDPPLAPAPQGDIEIKGLPQGLTVSARVELPKSCGGPVATSLQQVIDRGFGQAVIGGRPQIQQTETTRYTGSVSKSIFGGCNVNGPVVADVFVHGRKAGTTSSARREAHFSSANFEIPPGGIARVVLRTELAAKTALVNDADAQAPPSGTLTRSTTTRVNWAVAYEDSFGAASVIRPSLAFFRPAPAGLIVGSPGSGKTPVFRFEIDAENRACLVVGSNRQCGNRNQNITLTAGGVTLLRATDSASQNVRSVTWRFRLEPTFAAGQFDVSARAEDREPPVGGAFQYQLSDGQFEEKTILPWRAREFTVTVQ